MYAGGRSIVIGTPSGVTLAPEGGAHQSIGTPSITLEIPHLTSWEPAFAQDLEWTMLEAIRDVADALVASGADIATLVAPCAAEDRDNPNVVKAVVSLAESAVTGRALYFTRATAPYGAGPLYHHIGLYAYRAGFLKRYSTLAASPLEQWEALEQLRAMAHGFPIQVMVLDHAPPAGVDTADDLERVRRVFDLT